tara:strand:- start:2808 stop:3491 length:684 start_codon:yes stop_codon:yes gene_type:complete
LPDISKINNVEVANISKLDSITFADGQKVNNQSVSLVTDAHTFIRSEPASGDSSITFAHGTNGVVLDSTYDVYEWHFINMHPSVDSVDFDFQVNASGQTGFNETITSSTFFALHNENDAYTYLLYRTLDDQAQGDSYQTLIEHIAGDTGFDDGSCSGVLTLYAPSSTTYVKHFICRMSGMFNGAPRAQDYYTAGYINTTSAIDEIDFKFDSGNIDAGEIRMYGLALS